MPATLKRGNALNY